MQNYATVNRQKQAIKGSFVKYGLRKYYVGTVGPV